MAPTRASISQAKTTTTAVPVRRGITTRTQKALADSIIAKSAIIAKDSRVKRKAEVSPLKDKTSKRSALGNITNVCIIIDNYLL